MPPPRCERQPRLRSRAPSSRASRASGRIGVALALALGCTAEEFDPGPTAHAARGRIERIVVATGTIEPEKEVQVRPRIAGIIEHIRVEAGDEVEAGQPLIEIERALLESQVREAEAAVARAQAARDTLGTQLSYATVRSPLSGRVLEVFTEEGNAVSPVTSVTGGTLLISLAGTDSLYLKGKVDENEIARVSVGQKARIRTEAYANHVFRGEVTKIAPMGERIQNVTYFEVDIEITDGEAELLRPRMSGDADIVADVVEEAIVIPETALRYRGDQIYVDWVNRNGSPQMDSRNIEIGIVDGTRVQVLSGLEEGEEVRLQ